MTDGIGWVGQRLSRLLSHATASSPGVPHYERALGWIRANEIETGGVKVGSDEAAAYPEVTGYLVPTLLRCGETQLALRLVRWLLTIQASDGSFPSVDGVPHIFDTGQVLRGLLAARELMPEALDACRRTGNYLYTHIVDHGAGGFAIDPIWMKRYSRSIPLSSHLYVIPPLQESAKVFGMSESQRVIEQSVQYYVRHENALNLDTLTHFLAYELEALIELDLVQLAFPMLDKIANLQAADGSVPGKSGVQWVCTPGLAQLAVCWYKIGQRAPADRALNWLEAHQRRSGGFLGSYGKKASYFEKSEISWAVKFYLDAKLLQSKETAKSE